MRSPLVTALCVPLLLACTLETHIHRAMMTTDCVDGEPQTATYQFTVANLEDACFDDCAGLLSTGRVEGDAEPLGEVYFRQWPDEPDDYLFFFEPDGARRRCLVRADEVEQPAAWISPATSEECFVRVEPLD